MAYFITIREISRQPGKLLQKKQAEGLQIIAQNGKPAAYPIPATRMGTWLSLMFCVGLLPGNRIAAAQAEAARSGASKMTSGEIDAEMAAARLERRSNCNEDSCG